LGVNFCARISYERWGVAKKFFLSREKEQIVKIETSPESSRKCYEMELDKKPIKVRMLRVELDSGEPEILVTSLTNIKNVSLRAFPGIIPPALAG
jgi:hypothetical protein